jgi:hypothetical protein
MASLFKNELHQDFGTWPLAYMPFGGASGPNPVQPAPEAAKDLGALDQSLIERLDTYIRGNRQLNWKLVQRGFWVHGMDNLRAYFASAELFTMQGHADRIRCPTLITMAEHDPVAAGGSAFMEALRCPKTLMHFTAEEGADGHCSLQNRSLLNQRVLDWLDEQFGASR